MLSSQKADKECHSADAETDALSKIILGIRFRRREELQTDLVQTLLSVMHDGKGQEALNSCPASLR